MYIDENLLEFCLDFYQGLAPMLEVKSEGIPSWDRDDDFLLENEATSEEAPNFSLDLKALADDLAKVDLAKRLFIESDLLPPELRVVDTNEDDNQVPEKRMKSFETFEELYSIYLADEKIAEDDDAKKEDIISSSNDPSDSKATDMARVSEQDSESRLHDLGRGVNHVTGHNSMFQQGSSVSNLKANSPTHQASLPHLQDVSRPAEVTNSLDDELDNLLDASNLNKKDSPFQSVEVKDGSTDYGANRGAFSRYFQEDPSRPAFPVIPGSLDDELDNLLEETSKPTQVKIDSAIFPPSSSSSSMDPGLKLKAVDDFDSWMDSL
ncbi:hypothetical protein RND81_11G106600 [Saponaria officinalis]|uniref:Uncharacterized protein n=1 Tax=Saponaria officinalis TaxID=3572 RepID=A0AAW1HJH3_SAPOF